MGKFQRGNPGGGRKPGSRNKASQLFQESLHSAGFNAGAEIAALYRNAESEATKVKLLELTLRYSLPVPAPEVSEPEEPQTFDDVPDEDLLKAVTFPS